MTSQDLAAFERIVRARRSVKQYDASHPINDTTLRELFELTVLSPSSFNLQHWRFVVVRDAQRKQALRAVAFGQPQVEAAGAVVCVCGKLDAYEDTARIYADAPDEVRERMMMTIPRSYRDDPRKSRDEAIRSGSLAAMSLMLAAQAMDLATGPMIGFDPAGVSALLELPDNLVPVMLVVLGKQAGTLRPRMSRLGLDEVVKLENFGGEGLAPG